MPKHSTPLRQGSYHEHTPQGRFGGRTISRKIYFQKPRLTRDQKVYSLTDAPIFAGQKIILHRPVCTEHELEGINYHQPATVTRLNNYEMEVGTLCETQDKCFREVTFALDPEDFDASCEKAPDDEEDVELPFPFSIVQSSPLAIPFKPHQTCADIDFKELYGDMWEFWVKIRNRIYKDVKDGRGYKKHFYRKEARKEFKRLFHGMVLKLFGWYDSLDRTFHPTEESRIDLAEMIREDLSTFGKPLWEACKGGEEFYNNLK